MKKRTATIATIVAASIAVIGALAFFVFANFSLTVEEGTTAIVLDDDNHFVEANGPGFYWVGNGDNIYIHDNNEYAGVSYTIPGLMSVDGVDETVWTDYRLSISLMDSIKYAKAHPELVIYEDFGGIQNSVATAIGKGFYAAYEDADTNNVRFIPDGQPTIMTDAASSASYMIEKAEADAAQAATPVLTPAPEVSVIPQPESPHIPPMVPPVNKKDPAQDQPQQSYKPSYLDKYEFRCWSLTGSLDTQPLITEFLETAKLTSYGSLTIAVGESVHIIRNTELPCGFTPADYSSTNTVSPQQPPAVYVPPAPPTGDEG